MKDITGKELHIGDNVVFYHEDCRYLAKGTLSAFKPKFAVVKINFHTTNHMFKLDPKLEYKDVNYTNISKV